MTLLEICEPLFLYVCRLNRSARVGRSPEISQAREEVKELFDEMKSKSSSDVRLLEQYEKIELPLIFFVDSMIEESDLGFASEWGNNRLAKEKNELAGDDRFFELMEDTLVDTSEAATERLSVFYTCLGLGFTGAYFGDHEYLRKRMMEMSARIRKMMDTDENARICPEAYQNLDTRDLVEPPGKKLLGIVIALVGMVFVLFIANFYLFRLASDDLTRALHTIIEKGAPYGSTQAVPSGTQAVPSGTKAVPSEAEEPREEKQ